MKQLAFKRQGPERPGCHHSEDLLWEVRKTKLMVFDSWISCLWQKRCTKRVRFWRLLALGIRVN